MIRVMIADDHQLFAEGLSEGLTAIPDLRVVGVVSNGSELLERLKSQPADVLLIDLEMPGLDGMGTLAALPSSAKAIVVSMHDNEQTRQAVAKAGAMGMFSKGVPLLDIAAAIRAVADGEALVAGVPVSAKYRQPTLDPGAAALTDRETEILSLLAKGVSSTEDLADRLFISQKTVKNHLASIFSKLSVADRTQAAIEAIRLGIAKPK
jgi:DNA-binding NarL/FixJ family response regulator